MNIAGFQKNSFVDYPGNIAAVVFTPGCNLNCYYCHNHRLLSREAVDNLLSEDEVLSYLQERKAFLDAVVVSGGEPTMQLDLEAFILSVKGLGYQVKLDTNGTNPGLIKSMINKKVLDYIAMDLKCPIEKYKEICGTDEWTDQINESIDILLQGMIEYEFRTTFVPRLNEDDLLVMANRIKGADRYVLQQVRYRDADMNTEGLMPREQPYSADFFRNAAEKIQNMVKYCITRGV